MQRVYVQETVEECVRNEAVLICTILFNVKLARFVFFFSFNLTMSAFGSSIYCLC